MRATLYLLACTVAALITACGGGSLDTAYPFAASVTRSATLAAVGPPAPPTPAPLSMYDFGSGVLTLRHLALAGSTACYDVLLRTVAMTPIRVELTNVSSSACAQAGEAMARYDGASQALSAPKLMVVSTGVCYDVTMRTTQPSPMQMELTGATETVCAPPPSGLVMGSPPSPR